MVEEARKKFYAGHDTKNQTSEKYDKGQGYVGFGRWIQGIEILIRFFCQIGKRWTGEVDKGKNQSHGTVVAIFKNDSLWQTN